MLPFSYLFFLQLKHHILQLLLTCCFCPQVPLSLSPAVICFHRLPWQPLSSFKTAFRTNKYPHRLSWLNETESVPVSLPFLLQAHKESTQHPVLLQRQELLSSHYRHHFRNEHPLDCFAALSAICCHLANFFLPLSLHPASPHIFLVSTGTTA